MSSSSQSESKSQGLFIAIEGTDGSGKATQVAKLKLRLETEGYAVEVIDFPRYSQESSYFVRRYLNGDYGSANELGPFTPSLFYALDRFDAGQKIKQALASNKIVIADRFVGSNLAHQGQKFKDNQEKLNYWGWDQKLEFEMLETPRPSLNLILTLPPELSLKLIETRGNKKDIHEADPEHLRRSLNAYIELSEFAPEEFIRIDCARSGELMSIDEISNLIWNKIEPMLPEPGSLSLDTRNLSGDISEQSNPQYHYPGGLGSGANQLYQESIDRILAINQQMHSKLVSFLEHSYQDGPGELAAETLFGSMPIALHTWFDKFNIKAEDSGPEVDTYLLNLKDNDPSEIEARFKLSLVDCWPKNELSALPELIYTNSNLSLAKLEDRLASITYQDKLELFEKLIRSYSPGDKAELDSINYLFDVTSSAGIFVELKDSSGAKLIQQKLSPFLGYEIPELIKQANLEGDYRQAFTVSRNLYLSLVEQGYEFQAQYAILLGCKIRWQAKLNLGQLIKLNSTENLSLELRQIIKQMLSLIGEAHPNIAAVIKLLQSSKRAESADDRANLMNTILEN